MHTQWELVHVKLGNDAYHFSHHNTDTIYGCVDYDKIYKQMEECKTGKLGAPDGLMAEMMGLIKNAKCPFIVAGQGANNAAEELMELVKTLQIPMTTTLHVEDLR